MVTSDGMQPAHRPVSRRGVLRMAGAAAVAPILSGALPAPGAHATHTSKVVSRDFGFDENDSTQFLQDALDSGAHHVIIDYAEDFGYSQSNPPTWVTGPLFVNRNDFQITLQPNLTLAAKAGAYPCKTDSLLTIDGRTGITVFGYAVLRMNKSEYMNCQETPDPCGTAANPACGEWRMGIRLLSASNILIEGLRIRDTGGDGVYVGDSANPNVPRYCSGVTLRNVTCQNNLRVGLGVISVDGLLVEGCAFINSNGTDPEGGVDFELDRPGERLTNITLRDCMFYNNRRENVRAALVNLDSTNPPVSILFERTRLGAQTGPDSLDLPNFRFVGPLSENTDPGGIIEFRDTLIHSAPREGCVGIIRNRANNGIQVKFTRNAFVAWDVLRVTFRPIAIGPTHDDNAVPEYGNINWTDSSVLSNGDVWFLHDYLEPADSLGMANLQGDLTAVNPTGTPRADYGASPDDIGLAVTALTVAPAQTVTVTADPTTVGWPGSVQLTFTRTAADLSDSLAIPFQLTGTAIHRYDYDGLGRVAVIPAGQTSVMVPLHTQRPDQGSGIRTVNVEIQSFPSYTIGTPGTAMIDITN